jgi:hypothetical protein
MPRTYRVTFEAVSIVLAQDLLQIKGAAGKMLKILSLWLGADDTSLPTAQMMKIRGRFLPSAVVDGTGGSAATIARTDRGDAAASFTALANNTAKATTNGTADIVEEMGFHIYQGYDKAFPKGLSFVGPSESFVFELLGAPAAAVTMSGGAEVEESGG